MPRKRYNDRTFFKHDKDQKEAWKKKAEKAQMSSKPDLSAWIRSSLDAA